VDVKLPRSAVQYGRRAHLRLGAGPCARAVWHAFMRESGVGRSWLDPALGGGGDDFREITHVFRRLHIFWPRGRLRHPDRTGHRPSSVEPRGSPADPPLVRAHLAHARRQLGTAPMPCPGRDPTGRLPGGGFHGGTRPGGRAGLPRRLVRWTTETLGWADRGGAGKARQGVPGSGRRPGERAGTKDMSELASWNKDRLSPLTAVTAVEPPADTLFPGGRTRRRFQLGWCRVGGTGPGGTGSQGIGGPPRAWATCCNQRDRPRPSSENDRIFQGLWPRHASLPALWRFQSTLLPTPETTGTASTIQSMRSRGGITNPSPIPATYAPLPSLGLDWKVGGWSEKRVRRGRWSTRCAAGQPRSRSLDRIRYSPR